MRKRSGASSDRIGADVRVVAPALFASAGLGYLVYVGVGRLLQPADFAVFAGYWGLVFGAGGILASLEQESSRISAKIQASSTRHLLPLSLGFGLGLVLLAAIASPVVVGRVLDGSLLLGALVAVSVLGFAVQFTVRGSALGSGRIGRYSLLILIEALARAIALAILVLVFEADVVTCALAVAVGSFAWVLVPTRAASVVGPVDLRRKDTAGRVGRLFAAAVCTSAVVTGFPALAGAFTTDRERAQLGTLLAALTLTRLPLILLGPVQALLVPAVVHRLRDGGWPRARAFITAVVSAVIVVGAAAALALWSLGPSILRVLFGPAYDVGGGTLAWLTVASAATAVLLVLASALVALDHHTAVTVVWGLCLGAVVLVLALPLELVTRVVLALLIGPLFGALVAAYSLRLRRPSQ